MTLVDMGICDKAEALKSYVTSQSVFYPPHPEYVVKSTIKGFKKYWAGTATLEELAEACYLKDTGGLFRYYEQFLNEEEAY